MSRDTQAASPFVVNSVCRLTLPSRRAVLDSVSPQQHKGPAETIGQRLRRLRHERGLSQRELAGPGVSYAYISRIEAGARRPSVKALRMLARKLGVSADYLETGSEIRDTDERELQIADAELELRLADVTDEAEAQARAAARRRRSRRRRRRRVAREHRARPRCRAARAQQRRDRAARGRPGAVAGLAERAARRLRDPRQGVRGQRPAEARGRAVRALPRGVSQESPDDFAAQVRFTTYLSYALTDLGDLAGPQEVLQEALEQGRGDDGCVLARAPLLVGRAAQRRGRAAAAALDYIRRAIALLDVTEDTLHLARAHLLCGQILLTQDRTEEAAEHHELAERLLGPNAEPEDLSGLYADQSKVAARLGDARLAVERREAAVAALPATSTRASGARPLGAGRGACARRRRGRRGRRVPGGDDTARSARPSAGLRARRIAPGASSCAGPAARRRRSRCSSAQPISPPSRPRAHRPSKQSSDLGRGPAAGPVLASPLRQACGRRDAERRPTAS